jgi:hypothetical protein
LAGHTLGSDRSKRESRSRFDLVSTLVVEPISNPSLRLSDACSGWVGKYLCWMMVSYDTILLYAQLSIGPPSICVGIFFSKRLLCQAHLFFLRKIEKLQCQTKHIGVSESQRRVDEVCKPRRGKDIVKLGAQLLQLGF